jgi:DNA-binding CsgD family transcriptional regulator
MQAREAAGTSRWEMRVTPRETQILGWVAIGKSDWAIGRILKISDKTVNFHVENAKRKFGVGTRLQAVVAAMRQGLLG